MKYDLHVHTQLTRGSNIDPKGLVEAAKLKGLDGIAVTDHNTIQGAKIVQENNHDPDFRVIIGSEIKTPHGHILGLFLNDDIRSRQFFDVVDEINQQGGLALVAHPTAMVRKSLKHPFIEIEKRVHGIEAFNSRALVFENARALKAGTKFGLGLTGGSDAHHYFELGKGYTEFEGPLRKAIQERKTKAAGTSMHAPIAGFFTFMRGIIYK